MAGIKIKDIAKMNEKERNEKLKEMKIELIKSKTGNKQSSKINPKNIRKTIARLLTIENQNKKSADKKIEREVEARKK